RWRKDRQAGRISGRARLRLAGRAHDRKRRHGTANEKRPSAGRGARGDGRVEESVSLAHAAANAGQGPRRHPRRRLAHRACRRQADVTRMSAPVRMRLAATAFLAGGVIGAAAAALVPSAILQAAPTPRSTDELAALRASFRRPPTVPFPADNPFSEPKRALGEALFHEKRLSIDGSLACASCHERGKGFADGKAQGRGVPGRALKRHTPTLWNLAGSPPVFWEGGRRSLEGQVGGPIESPTKWRSRSPRWSRVLPPIPPWCARSRKHFPRRRESTAQILPRRLRPTSAPSCRPIRVSTAGSRATSTR